MTRRPEGEAELGDRGPRRYSLAYERFVQADNDTVGLLAYALFKSAVRQEAMAGADVGAAPRAPVAAMIEVYRQAAEQRVSQVIADAIAQATPDIQASATVEAVNAAREAAIAASNSVEGNLKSHIDEKTSFKQAMLTSFAGWLLTLGVTAIIIFLAGRPSVEDRVRRALTSDPAPVATAKQIEK